MLPSLLNLYSHASKYNLHDIIIGMFRIYHLYASICQTTVVSDNVNFENMCWDLSFEDGVMLTVPIFDFVPNNLLFWNKFWSE